MYEGRRTRKGDGLRAALLFVAVAGGIPTAQGFRRDEVECEEAVAYLADCCSGFDPEKINCTYVSGCDDDTYPSLLPSESECIFGKDCSELQNGICQRVLARQEVPAEAGAPAEELCQ